MNNTLRYRTMGGAVVVWKKTGASGGTYGQPIGTWTCLGCGDAATDAPNARAQSHATKCQAR